MTNREILIALCSSVISGFIVWVIQQSYLNRREKRKENDQRTIRANHPEKVVTDDIFEHLAPGNTVELMKEMLGVPKKYNREDYPVFSDERVETHSYLYSFKNAYIKITSKDNETINSLTLIAHDDTLSLDYVFFPADIEIKKLGQATVPSELIKYCNHTFIQTIRDASFALGFFVSNPVYQYYTLFGFGNMDSFKYHNSKDPNLFVGGTITGVCISDSEVNSYYIHDFESR